MRFFVTNKPDDGLGKSIEADSPEEAVKKARLKGTCTVRWGVKWGEPGKPGKEGGEWWFASSATVQELEPKPTVKPPEPKVTEPEPPKPAASAKTSSKKSSQKGTENAPRGAGEPVEP